MESFALQVFDWNKSNSTSATIPVERTKEIQAILRQLDKPVVIASLDKSLTVLDTRNSLGQDTIAFAPDFLPEQLGDRSFKSSYNTRYTLYAGAMANGISSEELVIAMGKAGMMGSFGAGGLLPERIERAILNIKAALPDGPYAFNLINSPIEPALEARTAELYVKHNITVVEASAYLGLTLHLVWYRASGLSTDSDGKAVISHRIIAKVSRKEIAKRFMEHAPEDLLNQLVGSGKITQEQAVLALTVPMADDITVEGDSGGHTDNRPLVNALPAIINLRDVIQAKNNYAQLVRIGAAGGIGTPTAALAAFMMGAAYVVTGSINQACVESAASPYTRNLLAQAEMTDVAMAPASDMFEMGVRVQVLKRGTMFAMRGQKLFEIYNRYNSIEEIPQSEREKLESSIFLQSLDAIWQECVKFFTARDPRQVERAKNDPKTKMALIFRWYLGLSSRWSNIGEKGREMDYQIWCGPAMGAFNDWSKGTYLEKAENRSVGDVNLQILTGAAYLYRLRILEAQGVRFTSVLTHYPPQK